MTQSLPPKSLVLYADDDADDRELLADAFQEYSSVIDLVTFEDGLSLLDFLRHSPLGLFPCLIILDINMPGINGKHVLQKIRTTERFADVPVVVFTTSTLPSEAAFAKAYDAGFVTKPLYTAQIKEIISQLIDHCTDEVKERVRGQEGR